MNKHLLGKLTFDNCVQPSPCRQEDEYGNFSEPPQQSVADDCSELEQWTATDHSELDGLLQQWAEGVRLSHAEASAIKTAILAREEQETLGYDWWCNVLKPYTYHRDTHKLQVVQQRQLVQANSALLKGLQALSLPPFKTKNTGIFRGYVQLVPATRVVQK